MSEAKKTSQEIADGIDEEAGPAARMASKLPGIIQEAVRVAGYSEEEATITRRQVAEILRTKRLRRAS